MRDKDIDYWENPFSYDEDYDYVYREIYMEWIKDFTNNPKLSGQGGGVKLALDILCATDPFDFFSGRQVVSEQIGGLSQTFAVNEDGIPTSVLKLLEPYHLVGTI